MELFGKFYAARQNLLCYRFRGLCCDLAHKVRVGRNSDNVRSREWQRDQLRKAPNIMATDERPKQAVRCFREARRLALCRADYRLLSPLSRGGTGLRMGTGNQHESHSPHSRNPWCTSSSWRI